MCTDDGRRETGRRLADGELSWEALRARARILEGIRTFFRDRGFLEVDPPIAQAYPNIDPNVFPVKIADASGRATRFYLHTSPEPAMKVICMSGHSEEAVDRFQEMGDRATFLQKPVTPSILSRKVREVLDSP